VFNKVTERELTGRNEVDSKFLNLGPATEKGVTTLILLCGCRDNTRITASSDGENTFKKYFEYKYKYLITKVFKIQV